MEEASSGESDYDDSSDEEQVIQRRQQATTKAPSRANAAVAVRGVADSEEDEESDDDEEHEDGSEDGKLTGDGDEDECDDSQASREESDDDDEDESQLPLAQRIQRQSEHGVDLKDRRKRKAQALQIASERLHANRAKKLGSTPLEQEPLVPKERKSKHAPTEASSKRADFYKRRLDLNESGLGVDINAHRYKPRDPRVNNLNGHLDLDHFETNYSFLNDMRKTEVTQLKKRIAARKKTGQAGQERRRRLGITNDGPSGLEDDQAQLKQLLHEKAEHERRQLDRAVKKAVKQKISNGGNSSNYIPKRKELKRLQMEAKYEELQKRGGDKAVERAVAKRRKKNKSRDSAMLGDRL